MLLTTCVDADADADAVSAPCVLQDEHIVARKFADRWLVK